VLDPGAIPSVDPAEVLARYVLFSGHFRTSDNSVKPNAFIPHPYADLSLTRHVAATDAELWAEGQRIAVERTATLYGRADVPANAFTTQGLRTVPDPLPENPNHAVVNEWPKDKPAQKLMAIQIASKATYLSAP